jgi:hypothetical protein
MADEMRDRDVILERYANGAAQLEAAIADLGPADLDKALDAESWTIRQIVHHVVDGDDIWKLFIKTALGNSEAVFSLRWYWELPQTEWAERWAYARREIEPSLALLRANRRHVVGLLQAVPGAWERSIVVQWPHQEAQRATVGWVIEMQADHVAGHIEDIERIRAAHGL